MRGGGTPHYRGHTERGGGHHSTGDTQNGGGGGTPLYRGDTDEGGGDTTLQGTHR